MSGGADLVNLHCHGVVFGSLRGWGGVVLLLCGGVFAAVAVDDDVVCGSVEVVGMVMFCSVLLCVCGGGFGLVVSGGVCVCVRFVAFAVSGSEMVWLELLLILTGVSVCVTIFVFLVGCGLNCSCLWPVCVVSRVCGCVLCAYVCAGACA